MPVVPGGHVAVSGPAASKHGRVREVVRSRGRDDEEAEACREDDEQGEARQTHRRAKVADMSGGADDLLGDCKHEELGDADGLFHALALHARLDGRALSTVCRFDLDHTEPPPARALRKEPAR